MKDRKFIPDLKKLTDKPDIHWNNRLFVISAFRWSNYDAHSYPVGAYKTLECAIRNANKEVSERGGKYGCVIYATQHTNKVQTERLVQIYEIESPYKNKVNKQLVYYTISNEKQPMTAKEYLNLEEQDRMNYEQWKKSDESKFVSLDIVEATMKAQHNESVQMCIQRLKKYINDLIETECDPGNIIIPGIKTSIESIKTLLK